LPLLEQIGGDHVKQPTGEGFVAVLELLREGFVAVLELLQDHLTIWSHLWQVTFGVLKLLDLH
jgi:hypothetical protein